MKKISTIILGLVLAVSVYGQQDPMFTKYMFTSLTFNPAYAGAEDHLSMGVLHRTQWFGFGGRGTPQTQSLSIHTPLKNDRVGVGLNILNDVIGPINTLGANISYAYRIPMGKYKLAIGLQGGGQYYVYDPTKITSETPIDWVLDQPYSKFLPNFGTGIYFSREKKFYIGLGVPKLIEWDLRAQNGPSGSATNLTSSRQVRHVFFTAGTAIPLNGDALIFKPSIMVRNSGITSSFNKNKNFKNVGAPTSYDIDLSLFFYQQLWLGASYRGAIDQQSDLSRNSSVNAFAAYYLKSGLRIGTAYDFPLNKIQDPGVGSFELFLGYDFDYRVKKVVTPRYF
jgi:type IX secretion system PorP/SprF family membrane protein